MRTMLLYTIQEAIPLVGAPEWKIRYVIERGYFVPKPELCKGGIYLFDPEDIEKLRVEVNRPRRPKRSSPGARPKESKVEGAAKLKKGAAPKKRSTR